ncbi:unnamed protein product [Acanthoscelides obtectus]|uniref:Mos1 transposase HTH domain-containing protein n=1 Tax=Acanthoscelides obtectus TaxID=200917 RepID=A0A9P0PM53_ACAOB|nr:unnamed protein product [Acanthoscelides obtectus]CAK1687787.1 Histone-lysine N-methyltransferase SETMAR [Acanthoscelides obtectus]
MVALKIKVESVITIMSYEAEQLWQELLSKDEIDDENLFGETSSDEYQPSDNMTDSDSDSGIKRPKSEKSLTASDFKYRMDTRQIRSTFLFHFKLGRKAAEIVRDINDDIGQGTTNERTAQWRFKKFRSGDESFEDKAPSGRPYDVYDDGPDQTYCEQNKNNV